MSNATESFERKTADDCYESKSSGEFEPASKAGFQNNDVEETKDAWDDEVIEVGGSAENTAGKPREVDWDTERKDEVSTYDTSRDSFQMFSLLSQSKVSHDG
jgi:hypothetical protein